MVCNETRKRDNRDILSYIFCQRPKPNSATEIKESGCDMPLLVLSCVSLYIHNTFVTKCFLAWKMWLLKYDLVSKKCRFNSPVDLV